jgi:uncharacterized protein (TIGR02001 family)
VVSRVRLGPASPKISHFAVAVAAWAASAGASAQDVGSTINGYLTLGNGYWSHGLSQNEGASVQLGVDYQHQSGFFAGAWAANVEFAVEYSYSEPREVVADVYAGLHRSHDDWSWTLMLGQYLYPDTAIPYDYTDLSGTVGFRDRVFYTASYSNDFYAQGRESLNQELSFAVPLPHDVEIGATLGRFAVSGANVDYTHWNVGVSKVVRRVVVDLRYYRSGYDWVTYLGDPDANQYVLTLSYALRGKRSRI